MRQKPLPNLMPALYSHRLSDIQEIAHDAGYAIAVHGSMQRDLDLVAVPWVEWAEAPSDLVARLHKSLGVVPAGEPSAAPHGRIQVTLLMGGACFMDLSIMPRTPDLEEQESSDVEAN